MKRIRKAIYQTAEQIELRIRERETEAIDVPPNTDEHRAIMKEIAQLRIYAEAKRWLAGTSNQVGLT